MSSALRIRSAIERVHHLRETGAADLELSRAVWSIKSLQSRRFASSYSDLLEDPVYGSPTRFFLEELYGVRDFSARDSQFHKIAGTIETLFPQSVVETAQSIAELHALTETLDYQMAHAWLAQHDPLQSDALRYLAAWRAVGRRESREQQLAAVLELGTSLVQLTAIPGLRTMLKLMRRPASTAGLSSLQSFLESGFETFGRMSKVPGAAVQFLAVIREREEAFIQELFDDDFVACATRLGPTLGLAR